MYHFIQTLQEILSGDKHDAEVPVNMAVILLFRVTEPINHKSLQHNHNLDCFP